MKILRVQLQNLNSLRGEHEVAFDAEPLAGAGIFAITGQTGAGKSTLLDAITLALYGRAARYGDSSNPEDMMSRHTGECQAETVFEVPSGRYRAVWQLRRARGQPDGKLQPARRYVYNEAGETLAQKINEVNDLIEELCGLDYHRFTRSVLLAQGEFANFLKAKSGERSELLEKLTGTSIYSELGKLVHETYGKRDTELEHRKKALSEMTLLSDEERQAKETGVEADQKNLAELKKRRDALVEQTSKAKQLHDHLEAETSILAKRDILTSQQKAAEPDLARLASHRKAQPFLPPLAQLEQTQTRAAADKKSAADAATLAKRADEISSALLGEVRGFAERLLAAGEARLEKVRGEIGAHDKQRLEAETWLKRNQADAALADEFPNISSELTSLENARSRQIEAKDRAEKVAAEIKAEETRRQQAEKELASASTALTDAQKSAADADAKLQQLLAGKDEDERQGQLDETRDRFRNLTELKLKVEKRPILEKEAEIAREQLLAASEKRDLAEALLKSRREHLETAQLMASFDEHRAQLKPGEACPLCGAFEHPLADVGAGLTPLSELQAQAREADAALAKETKSCQTHQNALTKLETELAGLRAGIAELGEDPGKVAENLAACEKAGLALKAELEKIRKAKDELAGKKEALAAAREKLGRAEESSKSRAEALAQLAKQKSEAANGIEQATKAVSDRETRLAALVKPFGLDTADPALRPKLETRRKAFADRETALRLAQEALARFQSDEKQVASDLTNLRKRAAPVLDAATDARGDRDWPDFDAALADLEAAQQRVRDTATSASERKASAISTEAEAEKQATALLTKLVDSTLPDLAALRAARLESEDADRFGELEKHLAEQANQLAGELKSRRESIAKLRDQDTPEGEAWKQLEAEKAQAEQQAEELGNRLAAAREQLRIDTQNRATRDEKWASLNADLARLKVWERLRGLIGDSTGKKFREYAQDISLSLLIRHANRHLSRLHERYRLQRGEGEKLDLEIEDLFQAGVTRPMASLSGGESFLASLALALGLSDLAGRNVQIDSLFIDEGFGSLDSDTLEVAISALEGLRQSNKMVGVISHVEILKERISTQIVVEKEPNGTSRLVIR